MNNTKGQGIIYKITNPENLIYIGQTISLEDRKKRYKHNLAIGQDKLHESFLKHGYDKHIFEVVEVCDISLIDIRERFYINEFNSNVSGLNIRIGGGCKLRTKEYFNTEAERLESMKEAIKIHRRIFK